LPVTDAFAHLCFPPQFQPAVQCKVDTLSTIEPEVETSVVPARIGYHKFPFALNEEIWFAG